MAKITIAGCDGKFGLWAEFRVKSGKTREIESSWDSDRGYATDAPIYEETQQWILAPEYSSITALEERDCEIFLVHQAGQSGVYFISASGGEGASFIGGCRVLKDHWIEDRVDAKRTIRGGFIIPLQTESLKFESDYSRGLLVVTVGTALGILSLAGHWFREPAYQEILRVTDDVWVLRRYEEYELLDFESSTKAIAGPARWAAIKAALDGRGLGDEEVVQRYPPELRSRLPLWRRLIGATTDAESNKGAKPSIPAAEYRGLEVVRPLTPTDGTVRAKAVAAAKELKATAVARTKERNFRIGFAARSGGYEEVKSLLADGAAVDSIVGTGFTPLVQAADGGHHGVVGLLLEHGAAVNAKGSLGVTPLLLAARAGHFEVVRLLLENRAAVDASDDEGFTPLMEAARHGHRRIVELLLKKGANPAVEVRSNMPGLQFEAVETALGLAECNGHKKVADLLREAGEK